MKVIESTRAFREVHSHCVATIGKFDGVHRGHQAIVGQLLEQSRHHGVPAVAIVTEPHPEEFFAGDTGDCPARLSEPQEKIALLDELGVDCVYLLRFDRALSGLSAQQYIRDILVEGLGIRALIAGSDFRFGHHRQGDFALLQQHGARYGFDVIETASCYEGGERISSTGVREHLQRGDFGKVEAMLGRPYGIAGNVVRGQQLGRDLGFPTCNVQLDRRTLPLHGVYACRARIEPAEGPCFDWPGAANIGYRPTVSRDREAVLEVHLLDYRGDLYGAHMTVFFSHKVRDEEKFDSLEALKEQIARDVEQVRAVLQGEEDGSQPNRLQDNESTQ
ncbi:MAG: bifunctional riboflavin kinase/FAD synthetase [Pseudohongiellaceae bacterium]